MAGRILGLSLLAAVGFLLLFSTGGDVGAITYKMGYSTRLSCNGPDGTPSLDDSCTGDAYAANATADILSRFSVPNRLPKYSNYKILRTFGTPAGWKLAIDKEIPDGAAVGRLVSLSTLALFGGNCDTTTLVTIPMYDCTTANFEGVNDGCATKGPVGDVYAECDLSKDGDCLDPNELPPSAPCNDSLDNDGDTYVNDGCPAVGPAETTLPLPDQCADKIDNDGDGNPAVSWNAVTGGKNLMEGKAGGLPRGCTQYPTHANDAAGGVKPRARYMGATVVTGNNPPTQLQFLLFSPDELSQRPAPEASLKDEVGGYVNFVVLNNPAYPAAPGDSLDEFCTQLESNTTLWGKTGGEGSLEGDIAANWACPAGYPCDAGNFWTVKDFCNTAGDDDLDKVTNEMCGIQRVKNPAANKGMWGTGTHLDGAYGESYLDIDGDGISNNEDECPYTLDSGLPANDDDDDHINDLCDPKRLGAGCVPVGSYCHGTQGDEDNDGLRNQQDNCPIPILGVIPGNPDQTDTDKDAIGDICDAQPLVANGPYVNDQPSGGICIGATDADGDGFCDATENLNPTGTNVLSVATNTGGLKGETDADTINCPASGNCPTPLCSDTLDNDSDTFIDALDAGCSVPEYTALDYAVVAATPPADPGIAPRTCSDWSYYDSNAAPPSNGIAPEVNQDRDALTNAADPNCGLLAGDTDQDGKVNASDNCPNDWNPTQLDTDGDTVGDACDTDDDADNILDTVEWAAGSDAKNVCDPVSFDTKPSNTISVADIVAFTFPLKVPNRPCLAPVNYNVCR